MRITFQPVWDVQNLPSSAALGGRIPSTQAAYSSVGADATMTKLELKINGQPFDIELHDGVQVSVEDGKMVVRNGESNSVSSYAPFIHRIDALPWVNSSITVSGDETAYVISV